MSKGIIIDGYDNMCMAGQSPNYEYIARRELGLQCRGSVATSGGMNDQGLENISEHSIVLKPPHLPTE